MQEENYMNISRLVLVSGVLMGLTGCTSGDDLNDLFMGVYFVTLDASPAEVVDLAQSISTEFDLDVLHIYDSASEGFSVRLPHLLVEELKQVDGIQKILLDERQDYSPKPQPDADFSYGDEEVTDGILRIGGPYQGGLDLSSIHVAVIDTGIDGGHSDLNVVAHRDLVGDSTPGDAHDGDPQGHGTHVAGTIGALANGEGVAGVAPGVALHSVRVLGSDGSGYYSDIIAGIEYVLENPEIKVVNMSLGGPMNSDTEPLQDAIDRLIDAGVIVCIAAGNETQNTRNVSPAGYDSGIIVSAYSVGEDDFAWFSNFGDEVDIAALGTSIYSTYPGGGYESLDGTSMATPHVAGAAALFAAQNTSADNASFLTRITNQGEDNYPNQGGDHPEPLLDISSLIP
jgi:subtilisin family serine protease